MAQKTLYIGLGKSSICRQVFESLKQDTRFQIVGRTHEAAIIERDLRSLSSVPNCLLVGTDLVTDEELPVLIRGLVRKHHVNVVVLGVVADTDAGVLDDCLGAGAVHVEPLSGTSSGSLPPRKLQKLLHLIELLADVRGMDSYPSGTTSPFADQAYRFTSEPNKPAGQRTPSEPSYTSDVSRSQRNAEFKMVGIVSSTGGLKAVRTVLSRLPHNFDVPLGVVQHLGSGSDKEFARLLSQNVTASVHLLAREVRPLPGNVYIAPSGRQMVYTDLGKLALRDMPGVSFTPSGDVFLRSLATHLGARSIGVILTGMGGDGASGLLALREAGGRTIAQDQASSSIFGMPGQAIALRAAQQVLPLEKIGPALIRLVRG